MYPSIEDYKKAIEIAESLRKKGMPVGAVDIMISAIAINNNKNLITKDKDFLKIKNVMQELQVEILS